MNYYHKLLFPLNLRISSRGVDRVIAPLELATALLDRALFYSLCARRFLGDPRHLSTNTKVLLILPLLLLVCLLFGDDQGHDVTVMMMMTRPH